MTTFERLKTLYETKIIDRQVQPPIVARVTHVPVNVSGLLSSHCVLSIEVEK